MTRPGVVLREAGPEDAGLLLRFIRALAEYEQLGHEVAATEADLRETLFGPSRRAHALLAEADGEAVGFCIWFYSYSTFTGRAAIHIEDVFVDPASRGRGIGRTIFAHLAARAVREGCPRLDWAVLDWNAPSIGFYRGIGARPMDEWTGQRLAGDALARLAAEGG